MPAGNSDYTVDRISKYIESIQSIMDSWENDSSFVQPWFRGLSTDRHLLIPKLYRIRTKDEHSEIEENIRIAFQTRAPSLMRNNAPSDSQSLYFIMQHYGVPTRLLDWTESALVALYFALYNRDVSQSDPSVVWVLNPFSLNRIARKSEALLVQGVDDEHLSSYLPKPGKDLTGVLPVAVQPAYTDRRMSAQQSRFTLHGTNKDPLESIPEMEGLRENGSLVRVLFEVNNGSLDSAKNALATLGVLSSTVFPDLEGLAQDIVREYMPDPA